MSDADTCDAETASGDPCQHPATEDGDSNRCWIDAHNDTALPTESGDPGRPSQLDEYEEDILAGARQGMTLEGCARLAGVAEKTLHSWINKHEEFRKSLNRARAHGELQHLQSVNDAGSRFILERSFGYTKTERREVEADIEHGGDGVTIEFPAPDTDAGAEDTDT